MLFRSKKGSPYRIGEISISASIPPAVSFAIGRIGDIEEELVGEVIASSELVDQAAETGELVLALDGTTVDETSVTTPAMDPEAGAMPPSRIGEG